MDEGQELKQLTMAEMVATGGPVREEPAPRPPDIRVDTWPCDDWREDYYAYNLRRAREALEDAETRLQDALTGVHCDRRYRTLAYGMGEEEVLEYLREQVDKAEKKVVAADLKMQTEMYGPGYLADDEEDEE